MQVLNACRRARTHKTGRPEAFRGWGTARVRPIRHFYPRSTRCAHKRPTLFFRTSSRSKSSSCASASRDKVAWVNRCCAQRPSLDPSVDNFITRCFAYGWHACLWCSASIRCGSSCTRPTPSRRSSSPSIATRRACSIWRVRACYRLSMAIRRCSAVAGCLCRALCCDRHWARCG